MPVTLGRSYVIMLRERRSVFRCGFAQRVCQCIAFCVLPERQLVADSEYRGVSLRFGVSASHVWAVLALSVCFG